MVNSSNSKAGTLELLCAGAQSTALKAAAAPVATRVFRNNSRRVIIW
jgi:hypothetical protein